MTYFTARKVSHELLPSVIWNRDSYSPDGATVVHINFSKLRFRVTNETTSISAKNRVDLSSISEVRRYITARVAPFFGPPCIYIRLLTPSTRRVTPGRSPYTEVRHFHFTKTTLHALFD